MRAPTIPLLALGLLATAPLASRAASVLLTFDDIPGGLSTPVQASYGGLNWTNINVHSNGFNTGSPNGWNNGTISPANVGFFGSLAEITAVPGAEFRLDSGYFTAGWAPTAMTVDAYLGGDLIGSRTLDLTIDVPSITAFDFGLVDRLTFSSGTGGAVVMDNLTISTIPEPSTYAVVFGLSALGVVIWRRRHLGGA